MGIIINCLLFGWGLVIGFVLNITAQYFYYEWKNKKK